MSAVVFCGPSTWRFGPEGFVGIVRRPPAQAGDVIAAVVAGASAIGLIDGVFRNALAVQHKEILYALSRGIPVLGASSIGALRAAECAAFGMIGIGRIHGQYACGSRVADADVALEYAPAELDYQPLTLPLVDVEATLEAAEAASALDAEISATLLEAARSLHFSERVWHRIMCAAALTREAAADAGAAIERYERSQKEEDARVLLGEVRGLNESAGSGRILEGFSRTAFFDTLYGRVVGDDRR